MVVVRVFSLETPYVLDGSVFVTKTARNNKNNGLNMAEQLRILCPELDTSRTRHCGSDPSLPKKQPSMVPGSHIIITFLYVYTSIL